MAAVRSAAHKLALLTLLDYLQNIDIIDTTATTGLPDPMQMPLEKARDTRQTPIPYHQTSRRATYLRNLNCKAMPTPSRPGHPAGHQAWGGFP
jgi:hypothetical protein